jgi:putative membrane protein
MEKGKLYKKAVIIISVAIPVVVALLFGVKIEGYDFSFLPAVYASINALTAVLLLLARWYISKGNRQAHARLMKTSMLLSAAFLVMYVIYHMTSDSTPYGGEGFLRYAYYFILITHILLSLAVVPLVLFAFLYAITSKFELHKKIVRYAYPVWLYVAVTGVVVYVMISPYYS